MENLKSLIYALEDLNLIRDCICRLSKSQIEQTEPDGLNILHHTIYVNYGEVVRYLLLRGFFSVGPPVGCSYLHLSCLLGHSTIANIILEYRPGDYYVKLPEYECPNWKALELCAQKQMENSLSPEVCSHLLQVEMLLSNALSKLEHFPKESLLPLEMAAITGQTHTVTLLLSSKHCGFALTSAITNAVRLDSPKALNLLLSELEHTQQDVNEAFVSALRRKETKCMMLLLEYGINIPEALHDLNAYHVMYMYSSAYRAPSSSSPNVGIDECTSALLSFNHDVNCKIPTGSYPLYSLIHALVQEKDQDPTSIPAYHLNTLQILLEGGADANFDEVSHAGTMIDYVDITAVGREPATSGLNSFFTYLQGSTTWRPEMAGYLDECCQLLLTHGARPDDTDVFGETPLHDLAKLWAMQHTLGHMHVDLSNMVALLLQNGADPNQQSSNGLYPVHYYFKLLLNLMGGLISYNRWKVFNKGRKVLMLLQFMNTDDAGKAYNLILDNCREVQETNDGMPSDVIDQIIYNSREFICDPKTLVSICQLHVWFNVDRTRSKLDQLPLPKRYIEDIKNMFSVFHSNHGADVE